MEKLKCYTIGHSNHTIDRFIDLLKKNGINCIVDVRSAPYSKYTVQFNKETIEKELKKNNIKYIFMGEELGARQTRHDLLFPDGKVDFEKVKEADFFKNGIQRIINGIKKGFVISVMCTEKDPLVCHRFALVSAALKQHGVEIEHILENGDVISQSELEKKILDKQLSLFYLKEDAIAEAYKSINKKIAYKNEEEE
ncbi:MAG: DUF488 domain-containing protein [Candidatus Goldbacteria bacterium]|nr:DUF488 domain-containing protein [Candidatus Goldiibacteriota bacterium]